MLDAAESRIADELLYGDPGLDLARIEIPTRSFLGIRRPARIAKKLRLGLTDQCYLPKAEDRRTDWIARVALPAFRAYRRRRAKATKQLRRFCTIGTGAGLDALVAAEILQPALIAVTDVHRDVVDQAMVNILANLKEPDSLVLRSGTGDLLSPFLDTRPPFDLIYENLPNIPLPSDLSLDQGQASSSFIAPRPEDIPATVSRYLLELHFAFLLQAPHFLAPGGAVLCSIGGRQPLQGTLACFQAAGYAAEVLLYTWKVQSEPDEVIAGYARAHRAGQGPFFFYRARDLEALFADHPAPHNRAEAEALEERLKPKRIDAVTALRLHRRGEIIAHSVAVIEGRPDSPAPVS